MAKKESAKRGHMTRKEILNHLNKYSSDASKKNYLQGLLEKEKLLAPRTRAEAYELLGDFSRESHVSRLFSFYKEPYSKSAKIFEEIGDFERASKNYSRAGLSPEAEEAKRKTPEGLKKSQEMLRKAENVKAKAATPFATRSTDYRKLTDLERAELYEKSGSFFDAERLYKKAGDFYKVAEMNKKIALENKGRIITDREDDWQTERIKKAADNYLKANMPHQAIGFYEEMGWIEDAAELAESTGDITRAIRLYDKQGDFRKVSKLRRQLKGKEGLEKKMQSTLGICGILGGIFFLSPNLTGNAVGGLNQPTSNILGIILFLVGIIGAFFYFRKKRR